MAVSYTINNQNSRVEERTKFLKTRSKGSPRNFLGSGSHGTSCGTNSGVEICRKKEINMEFRYMLNLEEKNNIAISIAQNMQLKLLIKVSVKKWLKLETKAHCLVQLLTAYLCVGKGIGGTAF